MTRSIDDVPTHALMLEFLKRVIPGSSQAIERMRNQMIDFACSLTGRTILLRGPVGAGKSTIARVLGLFKRVAPLGVDDARLILENVLFDGHNRVDLRSMPWYVELTVTGLVEQIAEVQLFGSVRGAYTGALDRPGVFEEVISGRSPKGREPSASLLTGGVVFLDEIGDLSPTLQSKLLPVLSGAPFYRIGGEGQEAHEMQFHGVAISASWRNLDASLLRPDLLSRISAYVIDVPGIDDRRGDFGEILGEVQRNVLHSIRSNIDRVTRVEPLADRAYWRGRREKLTTLPPNVAQRLKKVDWSRRGNLRGLTAAVEQILAGGRDPDQVIEEIPFLDQTEKGRGSNQPDLLSDLLRRATNSDGLAGNVRRLEVEQRIALSQQLLSDSPTRVKLAEKLGLDENRLLAQVHQLHRQRKRRTTRGES